MVKHRSHVCLGRGGWWRGAAARAAGPAVTSRSLSADSAAWKTWNTWRGEKERQDQCCVYRQLSAGFFCEWTMLLLADYKGKLTIGPNKCRPCDYDCICKSMTLISGVSISISLWFSRDNWIHVCHVVKTCFVSNTQHRIHIYCVCGWLSVKRLT